jgi:hypothetical protein
MGDWGIGSCRWEWGHMTSTYEQSNECRAPKNEENVLLAEGLLASKGQ